MIKPSRAKELITKKTPTEQRNTCYFIDVETNVGRKRFNSAPSIEAVSIGIISVTGTEKPVKEYYEEFRPHNPVDREAFDTHNLSNEYLRKMDQFNQKEADRITELLKGAKAIYAHNAKFDMKILKEEF